MTLVRTLKPRPHGISSQTLPLREQAWTFTQGTHDAPRNEQEHIPHTGEFHPSLHSFLYIFLSSLQSIDRGFVQIEVQIQKPTNKKNPHLFHLHHSHIRPTPSQTHRNHFLIHKNPGPFSYIHASISRHYHMYTIVQSRIILSHQKPCKPV